ncbi:MAG: hypothetical protein H6702_19345 [Myxococcales bacterium]|nr:hypothetical protein [Myxococcales bacterium]
MLALVGCTDERLAALDGTWVVDEAALATDPRLADLPAEVQAQAAQAASAAVGAPLVLRDGARWIDGAPAGRLQVAPGDDLRLVGPDGAQIQVERPSADRMIWVQGRRRLPLRRAEGTP